MYGKYLKRIIDVVISSIILIFFWWVFAAVGILVRLNLGSPIIFAQKRPGKGGVIFTIYKFRTMKDLRDKNGKILSDEERLTRFGRILRSTSLDETPEFWNVLKGDMSLVGPRPLLVEYLNRYNKFQARRHEVKPGITGLAQVKGRNSIEWEEKFQLDVKYVDSCSLKMDMYILLMTLKKVLIREGISSKSSSTMEEFKGGK